MKEPKLDQSLNKHDKAYHQLCYDLLTSKKLNYRESNRAVVDTIGADFFPYKVDLFDGSIPLSQTKPIGYKTQLFPELVGFIRGETDLKWYLEHGMKIWTKNTFNYYRSTLHKNHPWKKLVKDSPEFDETIVEYEKLVLSGKNKNAGDLGNFYSKQWRSYETVTKANNWFSKFFNLKDVVQVDQIEGLISSLKKDPTSRYHFVSAWNPGDVKYKNAALSPCHPIFQAYVYEDINGDQRLDLIMIQRSGDLLLGIPFNKGAYSTLDNIIANEIGVKPGEFMHCINDLHLYCGQGQRSQWYKDKNNLRWLQKSIIEKEPSDVLDDLLTRLPNEPNPGYDHIPYILLQLSRVSVAKPPKLKVHTKNMLKMNVNDLEVIGYNLKDRAPPLIINGVKPKMAS